MGRSARRSYSNKMVSPETNEKQAEQIEEKVEDVIVITDNEVREYRQHRPAFSDDEIRGILKRQKQDIYRKRQ